MLYYSTLLSIILSLDISHTAFFPFFCKMDFFFNLAVRLKNSYSVIWLTLQSPPIHHSLTFQPKTVVDKVRRWFSQISCLLPDSHNVGEKKEQMEGRKEGSRQLKQSSKCQGQLRSVRSTFSFPNSCIRWFMWCYII